MALKSASAKRRVSNTRCGETSLLKRVIGNSCGRPTNSPAKVRAADFSVVQLRVSGWAMRSGKVATLNPARSSRPRLPGADSGNQGAGGAGGGESGERSCSSVVISLPWATSIAAWWTLSSTAKLPTGRSRKLSSPSITYISHSGRLRSRGRAWMREAWMQNWRQSPGLGRAMWRTWYSMSKFSSSIQ
jgi:hypothetical protein